MPDETKEMNKGNLSVLESIRIIFSRDRLGEKAALEHIKNNSSSNKKKK